MSEYLLLFKALHIVGFVAWFGGLFYLVRIFVYHVEAMDRPQDERHILIPQYQIMENRVYKIICNPGMMMTWTFGILMLAVYGMTWLGSNPWMHVKIVLLLLLTIYHLYCKKTIKKLETDQHVFTSFQFRLFNEVPTLFLVSIVLLAVYKNLLDFALALVGVLLFALALYLIARLYKNKRLNQK